MTMSEWSQVKTVFLKIPYCSDLSLRLLTTKKCQPTLNRKLAKRKGRKKTKNLVYNYLAEVKKQM